MKILHWAIIFIAIILPTSIICRNTVNSRFTALKDEVRLNNAIDTATKDAIDQIIAVSGFNFDDEFGDVINITPALAQETINTFFHTLAVNYNIPHKFSDNTMLAEDSSDSYIKNYFAPYVPAVVIVAYDGFYIYSQENDGSGYQYKLSSKIPYTYESKDGSYSIGYTLGEDVYLYIDEKCYSGRLNYNSLLDVEKEFIDYQDMDVDTISSLTNDLSMVLYRLQYIDKKVTFENNILPSNTDTSFLQDYIKDSNGQYTVGKFHENRRKVITEIISSCLHEEFNEHNRFADIVGNTYDFILPEITNDDWVNAINDITIMAFVQGIPIGTLEGTYFNNYALGGSQIVKRDWIYGDTGYVNGVTGKVSNIYHSDENCSSIAGDNYDLIFVNEDDAVAEGYFPCQKCN